MSQLITEEDITVDIPYCASSFLMYRSLRPTDGKLRSFKSGMVPRLWEDPGNRIKVNSSDDLMNFFERRIAEMCSKK